MAGPRGRRGLPRRRQRRVLPKRDHRAGVRDQHRHLIVSAGIAYSERGHVASVYTTVLFALISARTIVASPVFSQATVQHLTLASSLAIAGLTILGLTAHKSRSSTPWGSRARRERARGKARGRRLGRKPTAATGTQRRGPLPHRHLTLQAPPRGGKKPGSAPAPIPSDGPHSQADEKWIQWPQPVTCRRSQSRMRETGLVTRCRLRCKSSSMSLIGKPGRYPLTGWAGLGTPRAPSDT